MAIYSAVQPHVSSKCDLRIIYKDHNGVENVCCCCCCCCFRTLLSLTTNDDWLLQSRTILINWRSWSPSSRRKVRRITPLLIFPVHAVMVISRRTSSRGSQNCFCEITSSNCCFCFVFMNKRVISACPSQWKKTYLVKKRKWWICMILQDAQKTCQIVVHSLLFIFVLLFSSGFCCFLFFSIVFFVLSTEISVDYFTLI